MVRQERAFGFWGPILGAQQARRLVRGSERDRSLGSCKISVLFLLFLINFPPCFWAAMARGCSLGAGRTVRWEASTSSRSITEGVQGGLVGALA